jgi:hypothetical protein
MLLNMGDREIMRLAAVVGFASAASDLLTLTPVDFSSIAWQSVFIALGLLAMIYWYGILRLAVKNSSKLLWWAAMGAMAMTALFIAAIIVGLFSVLSESVGGGVGIVLGLFMPAVSIAAGYAMLSLANKFGTVARVYGILSLLAGAGFLVGFASLTSMAIIDSALYVLGSIILLRAARH